MSGTNGSGRSGKITLVTINGETRCIAEWARIKGIKAQTIYQRRAMGIPDIEAINGVKSPLSRLQQRELEDHLKSLFPEIEAANPDADDLAEICEKKLGFGVSVDELLKAAEVVGLGGKIRRVDKAQKRQERLLEQFERMKERDAVIATALVQLYESLGQNEKSIPEELLEIVKNVRDETREQSAMSQGERK